MRAIALAIARLRTPRVLPSTRAFSARRPPYTPPPNHDRVEPDTHGPYTEDFKHFDVRRATTPGGLEGIEAGGPVTVGGYVDSKTGKAVDQLLVDGYGVWDTSELTEGQLAEYIADRESGATYTEVDGEWVREYGDDGEEEDGEEYEEEEEEEDEEEDEEDGEDVEIEEEGGGEGDDREGRGRRG